MWGKVAHLESMARCAILPEHVVKIRTSGFDTDFVSQMKLTTLSLIHCFGCVKCMIDPYEQ